MPITVDLSEREMTELKELTRQEDAGAAVRLAAIEYVRYMKRMRLKDLSGKVQMDDNWREMDDAESRARGGN